MTHFDENESQIDKAQRIAFNSVATANLMEDRGFLRDNITLCFTAPLFATLVQYMMQNTVIILNETENSTTASAQIPLHIDTMFYGYPIKIVDSDEYAAYVSVATIK